jgi:N-acetylneuraminate synthase
MGVPAHQIASFELIDHALLRCVARTGKPIIMSTGMATLAEIEEAVSVVRAVGGKQLAFLKCTNAFPARAEAMHLHTIADFSQRFNVPIGLSDHTLGIAVPVAAVTPGACIVEKHLTLSRRTPGPDSAFSLEPHEFKQMVEAIRIAEKSLGRVSYEWMAGETASRIFRRSLIVVQEIVAGDVLSEENVPSDPAMDWLQNICQMS